MTFIPEPARKRMKTIHLELIDTICEMQKSQTKLKVEDVFAVDQESDLLNLAQVRLARDLSDSYIRMGSLIRRICDLTEPLLEKEKDEP